jgi:hypothetical protein
MSKYEREIEEILRKMDDGRPPTMSERVRAMNRRPTPIRQRRGGGIRAEVLLLVGLGIAFLAQTARWIIYGGGYNTGLADTIIGVATLVGFAIFALTLIASWFGGNHAAGVGWRGNPLTGQGHSPFAGLRARWNLLRMRLGYRRRLR